MSNPIILPPALAAQYTGGLPIIAARTIPKGAVLIDNTMAFEAIFKTPERHVMTDAIRTKDPEEYRRQRMEVEAPKVAARNRTNAQKFLRLLPRTARAQFFTVKANYLWHGCEWFYMTLEAAFGDALNDCAPVSITAPNGNIVHWQDGMTLEQVRFILDGNHAALSDGAL